MVKHDADVTETFSAMRSGPEMMPAHLATEKMPAHLATESKTEKGKKQQAYRWMPVVWIVTVVAAFLIGLAIGLLV